MMHPSRDHRHHDNHKGGSFEDPAPNLDVIFAAFGDDADLYRDVLQVKPNASSEHIQMAYFDRRSELFALLASIDSEEEQDDITASHRFHAERKMDAVVMAVRILGDPSLRQEYDSVLHSRKQQQLQQPPHVSAIQSVGSSGALSRGSSCREPDGVYAGIAQNISTDYQEDLETLVEQSQQSSPQRASPRRVSPPLHDHDDQHQDNRKRNSSTKHDNEYRTIGGDADDRHPQQSSKSSRHKRDRGRSEKSSKKSSASASASQRHSSSRSRDKDEDNYPQADFRAFDDEEEEEEEDDEDEVRTLEDTKTWDDADAGTVTSISTTGWTQESGSPRNHRKSVMSAGHSTTLSTMTNKGFISRIKEEVSGTVEDTLVSFEQVLNVFTLQEKDIKAVMGRIDKAKRQLHKRK